MLGPPVSNDARIEALRRGPAFGLGSARFVGCSAVRRRPRFWPAGRDGAFRRRHVIATDIRRRCTSPVTLGLRLARGRRLTRRLLILLADDRLTRLVMVVLAPQRELLINAGVAIPSVLALIRW